MQIHKALVPLLALGMLFGCGGSSHSSSGGQTPGTINVYLGADSIPGFSSVVVSVQKLEWSPDLGNWYPVGSAVGNTYDLVSLQNGNGFTATGLMVSGATLAPTTIKGWRITWVTSGSSPVHPSEAASFVLDTSANAGVLTMPTTTILPGEVVVTSGGTKNVELMITGAGSVQNTGQTTSATASSQGNPIYTFLNATGQGFDLATTCTLSGQLNATVTSTAVPIGNVEVYAEAVVDGNMAIVRRSMSDAQGNFVLDALPAGTTATVSTPPTYYVVSQAYNALNSVYYNPVASGPITASSAIVYSQGLDFPTIATPLGGIAATITPASLTTQSTWLEVSQGLPTPSGQTQVVATLIIRSANAATGKSQASDTVTVPNLPISIGSTVVPYTVNAQRTTTPNPVVVPILPEQEAAGNSVNAASPATALTLTYKSN